MRHDCSNNGYHTVWRHTLNGDRYCMANVETLISTLYGDRYDLAISDTLFSPWCYVFLGTFVKQHINIR